GKPLCDTAAPSGLSTGQSCNLAGFQSMSAPVPVDTVIDHLRASIPAALASDEQVGVLFFNATPAYGFELACTIKAGSTSCTQAGPSVTINAGTLIFFGAEAGNATQVSFGYELSTPGAAVPGTPVKYRVYHLKS